MDGINKIWPRWQVVELLGEGGFGKVYKAKRDGFGQETYSAIKVVKIPTNHTEVKEMTNSGLTKEDIKSYYKQSVYSLLNEIKLMDSFKSAANIVGIEDYEVIENEDGIGWTVYIRMELLTNLSDFIKDVPFGVQEVVQMGVDLCSALDICHSQKVIHRDLKPGNIFVSKFGDFKLGDFGVSKEVERANATMSQKGTKSYMAPEMIRLEKTYDHTVDIYALGLTMYELLNHGRMPFLPAFPNPYFPSDREEAMLKRIEGQPFPDIEGIGKLNDVLKKACAFNPKERYLSASEMREALLKINKDSFSECLDEIDITNHETKSDELTEHGWNGLFDKTENDLDQTMGVFNHDVNLFDKKVQDSDQTIGAFGKDIELFGDVQVEKTVEIGPREIVCEKCGKKAYVVFTNGYYCGEHLTLTSDDEKTKSLENLFKQYLEKDNKKAILKKMITLDNSPYLHHRLGKEYLQSNSKKYARESIKKAYELDSEDGRICKDMALVCVEEKNYKQALEIIEKAENTYSDKVILHATKAIIYHKLKQSKLALEHLIKACNANDSYTFEVHSCGPEYLLTEAAIFEFLYGMGNPALSISKDYIHHKLMTISSFYNISKSVYKEMFLENAKNHDVNKYGSSIPMFFLVGKDESMSRKNTLTKTYYIACNGIYMFSSVVSYELQYISLFELDGRTQISLNGTDLTITKYMGTIKVQLNKKHAQWIYDTLLQISKLNKKLGEK